MFKRELSINLIKIIDQKNLTVESVSRLANLSRKYVSNIISEKQTPSIDVLENICSALQVEPNDLLIGEKSKQMGKSEPLEVTEIFKEAMNERYHTLCPRCSKPLVRDNQAYCDACGQRLSWRKFTNATVKSNEVENSKLR
ncbi:MAG: helix-turn-helix transcriptional regulator [Oscillospiraceae bacterium]|nr:helix-turn-helix transcriptional regulator [Oscillospiraceae bacterium]